MLQPSPLKVETIELTPTPVKLVAVAVGAGVLVGEEVGRGVGGKAGYRRLCGMICLGWLRLSQDS
jgi:hypothetical protein